MIRAVAFDVDGTLVDLWPAIDGGLAAALDMLRSAGPQADTLTMADLRAEFESLRRRSPMTPVAELRRASFGRIIDALGVDDPSFHAEVCAAFFQRRFGTMRLFEDVRPALAVLRRMDYRIGVGSNGNSHVRRCGLAGEFSFEVYAHVGGVPPKPLSAFYQRMVALAGVAPWELAYVGDDPDNDVIAAAAAGLRTVLLRRSGPVPTAVTPEATITTLAQLPAVLADLP